ncbi:cytochrome P450 [Thozetella sp. PMI_491]|nr:cytochrome P450 [Thozetella sp. PMI_491]
MSSDTIATFCRLHPVLCFALVLVCYVLWSYIASWYRLRHFKGPALAGFSYLYMLGVCLTGRKPFVYCDLNEKYGPLARIGPNDLITDDPDVIRRMNGARSSYERSSWYKHLRVDARCNTLMSLTDTAAHDRLKGKLSFGYTGKENPTLEKGIDEQLESLVGLIRRKYLSQGNVCKTMDFARVSHYFTLDCLTRIAYGYPFGYLETDSDVYEYLATSAATIPFLATCTDIPWLGAIFLSPLALQLIGPKPTDTKGPGRMYKITGDIVAERFGPDAQDQRDMLGSFVRHGVPQKECESEVLFQLSAGADTTSAAIQTIMLYLATSRRAYTRLQEEIDVAAAEGRISSPITADEGKSLAYLQAVIYEGLRIRVPFAGLAMKQVPPEGDTIYGQFLPPGTRIGHNIAAVQRNTRIFGEDVDIFRPERWLNVEPDRHATMVQTVELVFGYGRWSCLGRPVAIIELNKIFVELLRRFDFEIATPVDPWSERNHNLFFRSKQWMRVTERNVGC